MSFLSGLKQVLAKVGGELLRTASREIQKNSRTSRSQRSTSSKTGRSSSKSDASRSPKPKASTPRRSATSQTSSRGSVTMRKPSLEDAGGAWLPGPEDTPVVYDVVTRGLPDFEYRPDSDNAPDPGEVVWTWVPYEENDGRGKDRPVLVLAEEGNCVIFGQMTSKDHDRDAAQEAHWGRYWIDLGTGDWDSQGRPSEMRLDRMMIVHEDQVRREGGRVQPEVFDDVLRALRALHS